MPWVGFEPMIPASELAKTVIALDRSATVTGNRISLAQNNLEIMKIVNFTQRCTWTVIWWQRSLIFNVFWASFLQTKKKV
jgi:hypothetical protein